MNPLLIAAVLLSACGSEPNTLMKVDNTTLLRWESERQAATSYLADYATQPEAVNLLKYVSYPLSKRSQGMCGNCLIWSATAAVEVQAAEQGLPDALSVQYATTGMPNACCGVGLTNFVFWYNYRGFFVPESNANADFQDTYVDCKSPSKVSLDDIRLDPQYAFSSLTRLTLQTADVDQDLAIQAIKSALAQGKPVLYTLTMPTAIIGTDFDAFWGLGKDTDLVDPGSWDGHQTETGFGVHAVVLVGYDDTNPNPNQHYWLALNSWGTNLNRPKGTFRVAQYMNYAAKYTINAGGAKYNISTFDILNVDFGPQPTKTEAAKCSATGLVLWPLLLLGLKRRRNK